MIRIFVIAEIRLYREGLEFALSRRTGLSVVGTASSAADETIEAAAGAEVILFDMSAPDAQFSFQPIRRVAPEAKIVALGLQRSDDILRCIELGIAGYVPRTEGSLNQLVATIESVVRGETLCSPRIAATLFQRVSALAAESRDLPTLSRLTSRQLEVARLLRLGMSNKEIASSLQIELPTAKNHVHAVLEKLGVHRRSEAAAHLAYVELDAERRSVALGHLD